jgi:hypothetical protein
MTPILGFAPDASPDTPGALLDCMHVIPYESGMKGAPTAIATATAALAAECRGAAVVTKLDGTRRVFAGTQTKLYELTGGVWTDRSVAGSYVGSSESRWSFCQFGDTSIASNLTDNMQSSAAGAFADITGAPKARIVMSLSNNFVMALDTNDGTFGAQSDRWRTCAQNNQADWTPNVATGANTGRLIAKEGGISAGLPLGDYAVVYKKNAVFLGRYVGGGATFQFNLIPGGDAGAIGQEAVCDIGGAHFFVSNDNFWIFDGTRPLPIKNAPRQWFLANSSALYRSRTKCIFDKQNKIVRVNYPSLNSTGACDACLVYHVDTNEWGRDDVTVEAVLNYISPGVTINQLDNYASTINGLPDIPYDSQFWLAGGQSPCYFNTSHQLVSMTGVTADSSITLADSGDDDVVTLFDRLRVRYQLSPSSAVAYGYVKMSEGDSLAAGTSCPLNDGKFDLLQSGRFHRVRIDMMGAHKESAYDVRLKPQGER